MRAYLGSQASMRMKGVWSRVTLFIAYIFSCDSFDCVLCKNSQFAIKKSRIQNPTYGIMYTCLDNNNVYTIIANDLCTGESGTSAIRKGAPTNHPERVTFLASVCFAVNAGNDTTQLAHEVHSSRKEEKRKMIEEIGRAEGGFHISVEQSVALKADCSIPWSKL